MFGSSAREDDALFDSYDAFVPRHVPEPGDALAGHDVLEGDAHVAFHRLTRALFEERGVYDVTFGYNLARLNLDRRHENAGYRYAVDADDSSVLHAEFTPTTEFCPQSEQLTVGSLRAWNGLAERHEFDRVRVHLDPMHQHSDDVNETLAELDATVDGEEGGIADVGPSAGSDEEGTRDDTQTETSGRFESPF